MDSLILLIGATGILVVTLVFTIVYLAISLCLDTDEDSEGYDLPSNLQLNLNKYNMLNNFKDFQKMSDSEKLTHLLKTAYCKLNPFKLEHIEINTNNITTESLLIRDRGISAFYFNDYYDQITPLVEKLENTTNVNERSSLLLNPESEFSNNNLLNLLKYYHYERILNKFPPFVVEDLIELNFKSNKSGMFSYSTILNLPLPTTNRKNNIVYFESKLLKFNSSKTQISLGLVSDPNYPNFLLPGEVPYSFAIESNGKLNMTSNDASDDMIVLPYLQEGDVVGFGYKSITGTLFLTHNGKLIHEMIKYFKFKLYPCIGIKNLQESDKLDPTIVNVNLGQLGFVYIEANVKKLGFCENKNDGLIGAPPLYNMQIDSNEIVLDKGDDIPPTYPDSFFGDVKVQPNDEKLTTISDPPSYNNNNNNKTNDDEDNSNTKMTDEEYELLTTLQKELTGTSNSEVVGPSSDDLVGTMSNQTVETLTNETVGTSNTKHSKKKLKTKSKNKGKSKGKNKRKGKRSKTAF